MRKAAEAAKVREYKLLISLKAANTANSTTPPLAMFTVRKAAAKPTCRQRSKRRDASARLCSMHLAMIKIPL